MIEIDIYSNTVVIAGQVVIRPLRLSPKQWIEFWEEVKEPYKLCGRCGERVKEAS